MKYMFIFLSFGLVIQAEEFQITAGVLAEHPDERAQQALDVPIEFSATGMTYFFKHVFNHPQYGLDILPNTFEHLEQFLEYGTKNKQDRSFVKSTLRLFTNKLKSSLYVNAYSFESCLRSLPLLLESSASCISAEQIDPIKKELMDLLYNRFLSDFEQFKENPEVFFGRLSDDIVKAVDHQTEQRRTNISVQEVRKTVLVFLELCINKLIWDPRDEVRSWESVQSISTDLAKLWELTIIGTSDELGDLFNSLVSRYCIFLELMKGDLPVKFFVDLKESVEKNESLLLQLAEQEEKLETRREQLLRIIHAGEAQARAREYGYTTLEERKPNDVQKLEVVVKDSKKKRRRRQRGKNS